MARLTRAATKHSLGKASRLRKWKIGSKRGPRSRLFASSSDSALLIANSLPTRKWRTGRASLRDPGRAGATSPRAKGRPGVLRRRLCRTFISCCASSRATDRAPIDHPCLRRRRCSPLPLLDALDVGFRLPLRSYFDRGLQAPKAFELLGAAAHNLPRDDHEWIAH